MPRVLVFGRDRGFVDRLRSDSRWEIAIAEHSDHPSRGIPDPTYWNLVVDDCANENHLYPSAEAKALGMAFYQVSEHYLKEMRRAHGIHFASSNWEVSRWDRMHLHAFAEPPKGFKGLEFNARSEQAELLADFVERFERQFTPGHLMDLVPGVPFGAGGVSRDIGGVVFCDAYEAPTICADRHYYIPWLVSINIADKASRNAALEYLCYRSAPKLWPDLYTDSLQPRKVKELEKERSGVAAELRRRLTELDQQIDAELAFYAPYFNLTVLGDDSLKRLVHQAFEKVFGFTVTDLDELVPEGERKTLDLRLERGAWSAFVEVRGSGTRNAQRSDLERLEEHYDEAKARYGESTTKILLFNGMYTRDHEKRSKHPAFNRVTAEEGEDRGICLMSAHQLLDCIEAHRNDDLAVDALTNALSRPGLLAIPS